MEFVKFPKHYYNAISFYWKVEEITEYIKEQIKLHDSYTVLLT